MISKKIYMPTTVKIHAANYFFSIVDRGVDAEGYILALVTVAIDSDKKVPLKIFSHFDLEHLVKVRDAVIEAEKNSRFFIARSGDDMFEDMSRKLLLLKKPRKEKVMSIRFDAELQTNFSERCKQSGHSMSEVLRLLMESYIATGGFSLGSRVA